MAADVPAHAVGSPVSVPFGRRIRPRLLQVRSAEPVGVQLQDVADAGILRCLEVAVKDPDAVEGKGRRRAAGFVSANSWLCSRLGGRNFSCQWGR